MVLSGAAALQVWLARELATYRSITNLSSDWRDGIAFCGLVHRSSHHSFDQLKVVRN